MKKMGKVKKAYIIDDNKINKQEFKFWSDLYGPEFALELQNTRVVGVLTYDSSLDDAIIKGLFKHDAAYDNQD